MPDYIITSKKDNPGFAVRVGDCSYEHADSVLNQLLGEPVAPDDLQLAELAHVDDAPPKRPWYRRFFS